MTLVAESDLGGNGAEARRALPHQSARFVDASSPDELRHAAAEESNGAIWPRGAEARLWRICGACTCRACRLIPGLATFFAQWLDRTGAPELAATWRGQSVTLTQRSRPYALDIPLRIRGTDRVLDTTLHVNRVRQVFGIPGMGTIRDVEIDPADRLLMWKERFGPPPSAPASWSWARWERWMADEVPWLMRSYEVLGATVRLVRAGQVAWNATYGSELPVKPTASDVTFTARSPDSGAEIIVVARGGWGGRQLTMHIAQRVAIQDRWTTVPR